MKQIDILTQGHLQQWQVEALLSKAQTRVICASRQIGKSLILRTICYKEMMENPGIEIIYAAMTIKQVKAVAFHPESLRSSVTAAMPL